MCLRPRSEADKCSLAATLHYDTTQYDTTQYDTTHYDTTHYDTTYDLTSEFRGNAPKLCGNKQRGEFFPKLGFSADHNWLFRFFIVLNQYSKTASNCPLSPCIIKEFRLTTNRCANV